MKTTLVANLLSSLFLLTTVLGNPVRRHYDTCIQLCAESSVKLQEACVTHRAASARRRCIAANQAVTESCYVACKNCTTTSTTSTPSTTSATTTSPTASPTVSTIIVTLTTPATFSTTAAPSSFPATSAPANPTTPTSSEPEATPTPIGQVTTYETRGCEYDPIELTCVEGETITHGVIQYGRWNNTECAPSGEGQDYETSPQNKTYPLPQQYLGAQTATIDTSAGLNAIVQEDPLVGVVKQYLIQYVCQQ